MTETENNPDTFFKSYATSTAFLINLSNNQASSLLAIKKMNELVATDGFKRFPARLHMNTILSLVNKGMLVHVDGEGYQISTAGKLICELLKLAGWEE